MSPIERAARALAERIYQTDKHWDDCVDDVRAVLEAIREPTDRMLSDGAFQIFRGERITADDLEAARRVWRGMTHAALTE